MNQIVIRGMACAAIALLAASCVQGPNYAEPAAPADSSYAHAANDAGIDMGGKVASDWYALFRSEALNGLVREALQDNPGLDAARHGLLAAQFELKAVSGAELPSLKAGAGVDRARVNGSLLLKPVNYFSAVGNQFSVGPSLAYDLDLFGGVKRAVEAQAAAAADARAVALDTYVTLVDQVVVAAFGYAAAERQIEVTTELVKDLADQLSLTESLEKAGKITRNDALQAAAQLENVRATLPTLEKQRDSYRNGLARLVGKSPAEFAMPALRLKDFALPRRVPVSLPSDIVHQRPDILAAEAMLHEATAGIGVAEAARFPSIVLSASYSQQATLLNQLFTQPGGVWSMGASLSAPLFEGGALEARAGEARERAAQTESAYRSTVVNAFVEVADALDSFHHDAAGYEAHARALAAAAANRDLAVAQYRAGKTDQLQVLLAEQQYQTAALSQVDADIERFIDVATLFRALGGGWWTASDTGLETAND
jgi:NodT family efflux transporter outer membrane factor (OMF) lipoprotein